MDRRSPCHPSPQQCSIRAISILLGVSPNRRLKMYRKMYLDVNVLSFYIREYGHQKLFIAEYKHALLDFTEWLNCFLMYISEAFEWL